MKIILFLLLTALPTFARLGETKPECEARYGKPVRTTAQGNPVYLKGGLEIAIVFWKDKAATLYIAKAKTGAPDVDRFGDDLEEKRDPLSEVEMDVLLKANHGGSEWNREKDNPFADLSWKRADEKADAMYYSRSLMLTDNEAHKGMAAEIEQQEANKLKDFGGFGETKAECDKRYGKPVKITGDEIRYQKFGTDILITFWKGKAASVLFVPKPRGSGPQARGFLLAHEQAAILKANAEGSQWKEDESNEDLDLTLWRRADDKAVAIYTNNDEDGDDSLIIESSDYTTHRIQEKDKDIEKAEAEEAKKLDGF
jgi:hypothetical protein